MLPKYSQHKTKAGKTSGGERVSEARRGVKGERLERDAWQRKTAEMSNRENWMRYRRGKQ